MGLDPQHIQKVFMKTMLFFFQHRIQMNFRVMDQIDLFSYLCQIHFLKVYSIHKHYLICCHFHYMSKRTASQWALSNVFYCVY